MVLAASDVLQIEADRDLERRVTRFLLDKQVPGLRNLEVKAQAGAVTLRGSVHSFYEKQLSHSLCKRVAGVLRLIDAVDVAK